MSEAWGLSISGRDIEMGRKVVELVKHVLGVEPSIDYGKRRGNYFVVRSGKRQVFEFFERFGFTSGRKAATVDIPEVVKVSDDREVLIGFLKGAFSSDGSFWYRKGWGQCRFEVSSVRFRDGFISLARKLGYQFRSYSYVHHGGHNRLPLHTAYLGTGDEVTRWMEQVGSMSDAHMARYRLWRLRLGERGIRFGRNALDENVALNKARG